MIADLYVGKTVFAGNTITLLYNSPSLDWKPVPALLIHRSGPYKEPFSRLLFSSTPMACSHVDLRCELLALLNVPLPPANFLSTLTVFFNEDYVDVLWPFAMIAPEFNRKLSYAVVPSLLIPLSLMVPWDVKGSPGLDDPWLSCTVCPLPVHHTGT